MEILQLRFATKKGGGVGEYIKAQSYQHKNPEKYVFGSENLLSYIVNIIGRKTEIFSEIFGSLLYKYHFLYSIHFRVQKQTQILNLMLI